MLYRDIVASFWPTETHDCQVETLYKDYSRSLLAIRGALELFDDGSMQHRKFNDSPGLALLTVSGLPACPRHTWAVTSHSLPPSTRVETVL